MGIFVKLLWREVYFHAIQGTRKGRSGQHRNPSAETLRARVPFMAVRHFVRCDILEKCVPEDMNRAPEMAVEDPSHELDMVPLFSETGALAEMEAVAVQGILEASDIPSTLFGSSTLPVTDFSVNVPKDRFEEAQLVLEEARAAGPAAAEAGERESEALGMTPETRGTRARVAVSLELNRDERWTRLKRLRVGLVYSRQIFQPSETIVIAPSEICAIGRDVPFAQIVERDRVRVPVEIAPSIRDDGERGVHLVEKVRRRG